MRFAIAAGILAQTLPAVSSTTSSSSSPPAALDSLSVLADAVDHHRHVKSLVAETANKKEKKKKTLAAVAAALKEKQSHAVTATATSSDGILKNVAMDDAAASKPASWMEIPVPCDPTIKVQNNNKDHATVEADTGVLSCGTTGLYYCKESKASLLGGFCVPKQSEQNSPKRGKGDATTTALRNQKKKVSSSSAKTTQEKQTKKTLSSMQECQPTSRFSMEDVDPDVGVLSVTECEKEGEECVKSNESSLGGICMSKQEQQQPLLGRGRQLVKRQQHRSLEQGVGESANTFDSYYEFFAYWGSLFECDTSNYDDTTYTGLYVCSTPDIGVGTCVGSFVTSANVESGITSTYTFSASYTVPYVQTVDLTYNYQGDKTCEIVFDGVTCNSCTYVAGGYCYDFDCSNALAGHAGSSCTADVGFPAFKLSEQCFFNTTTGDDDLFFPRCSICPDDKVPNPSANLTTVYGSENCTDAFLYGLFGFLSPPICSAVQAAAAESCGCSPQCSICGDGSLINPDATVQIDGESVVCANLYYGGLLGYISNNDCPAAQLMAASTCCDWVPTICNICGDGGEIQTPDFSFEGDNGENVTCAEVESLGESFFITQNQCGALQDSLAVPCCGEDLYICSVCPDNTSVTDPDRLIEIPGQPAITCGEAQAAGLSGFVSHFQCLPLQLTIPSLCGCGEADTGTRRNALESEPMAEAPAEVGYSESSAMATGMSMAGASFVSMALYFLL